IEVRVAAFSIASREVAGVSESTFYRYEILNRGTSAIENAYAGFFLDPDLGDAVDDLVGVDSSRGMFLVYNADDDDASYGTPPALGVDLLSGAASSSFFESVASGPTSDPSTGLDVYYYLQGLWGDGTPKYEFGNGYNQPLSPVTPWAYPGDPVTGAFWSEVNNDGNGTPNSSGDRRGLVASPEFRIPPGGTYTFDVGVLFAQGADRFDSITELRAVSDAVQAAYDDGSLFGLGSEVSFLPAPAPLAPAASADLGVRDSVRFEWEPVPGAEGYALQWGNRPEVSTGSVRLTSETSAWVAIEELAGPTGYSDVYWRVGAQSESQFGTPSAVRSFRVFRKGVLTFSYGAPVYLEVQNAEGTAVCPEASTDVGCVEFDGAGNNVYHGLNSTSDYYLSEQGTGSEPQLALYAPNDFEIRFTDEGSLAGYLFQPPYNVVRVPFEIWDIGVVAPGDANDPADDVRLIPFLFADGGGTCAFDYGESEEGTFGYPATDRIYAYYPADSYDAFEAAYAAEVEGAPENCYPTGSESALLDFTEGERPIQGQVFADYGRDGVPDGVLPGTGTVIQMYTTDPPPSTSEPSAPHVDLALTVGPNPSVGDAVARFTLASSGPVTVRVVDVLGREVAVLSQGARSAGTHALPLPSALAAGIYAVEVRTPTATASRMLTVIR
ncbi:MAG TPA: T9SS type A sorting domain-containing protein, partial [Rhodothermales bacterium]|nr:T9SS type A sorting domain-containing protein [Rhodothermales bacterium]